MGDNIGGDCFVHEPDLDYVVGWIVSTNGILHAVNEGTFYMCNQAVGMHSWEFMVNPKEWSNAQCKNCVRRVKKIGRQT